MILRYAGDVQLQAAVARTQFCDLSLILLEIPIRPLCILELRDLC